MTRKTNQSQENVETSAVATHAAENPAVEFPSDELIASYHAGGKTAKDVLKDQGIPLDHSDAKGKWEIRLRGKLAALTKEKSGGSVGPGKKSSDSLTFDGVGREEISEYLDMGTPITVFSADGITYSVTLGKEGIKQMILHRPTTTTTTK